MMIASRMLANCSGLIHPSYHKPSFQHLRFEGKYFCKYKPYPSVLEKISRGISLKKLCGNGHVVSVENNYHQLTSDDELPEEPFWLSLIRETTWSIRSLFAFLVKQPSQLKYVEWPSFQSTLKTAILTLVLVAALIVALSTVDSILSYVLALLVRKTPS